MLDESFVKSISKPKCPYCKYEMFENHSTIWSSKSWVYVSIEFMCNGGYDNFPPHSIKIRARSPDEWENHIKNLEF